MSSLTEETGQAILAELKALRNTVAYVAACQHVMDHIGSGAFDRCEDDAERLTEILLLRQTRLREILAVEGPQAGRGGQ
ncbi:hypothetical protein [Rhodovarius lipocyclicus]|uniref:hypothetical protein n=1 Tax=Rhodovarius lipocyclicus TaxID=268410 RepID=UPI00135C55AC|nr:hypothetical protein [Rhodovarius lipocyclicus]